MQRGGTHLHPALCRCRPNWNRQFADDVNLTIRSSNWTDWSPAKRGLRLACAFHNIQNVKLDGKSPCSQAGSVWIANYSNPGNGVKSIRTYLDGTPRMCEISTRTRGGSEKLNRSIFNFSEAWPRFRAWPDVEVSDPNRYCIEYRLSTTASHTFPTMSTTILISYIKSWYYNY